MGADLIGYMTKGPLKVSKAKLELAEAKAQQYATAIKAYREQYEELVEGDTADESPVEGIVTELERWGVLRKLAPNLPQSVTRLVNLDKLDWGHLTLLYDETEGLNFDPGGLISDFEELWNKQQMPRDGMQRDFTHKGDAFQVVFVGERSWGDTPEGHGYQVFDTLARLGLYDELGLE